MKKISSIYSDEIYAAQCPWMKWSLNDLSETYPSQFYKTGVFDLDLKIQTNTTVSYSEVDDFRTEMARNVVDLIRNANGRKIALLLSGIDSEAIAILLREQNADFECWHSSIHLRKDADKAILRQIQSSLGIPINEIQFSWTNFRNEFRFRLKEVGIIATMMYALWNTIQNIPKDQYIVCGNGAFRKRGYRFRMLQDRLRAANIKYHGRAIPFDARDILLRVLAQKYRRHGEFYFHSKSERQVAALFKDPKMQFNPNTGEIDDKEVMFHYFPEAKFRAKTEPWASGPNAVGREQKIVKLLEKWMGAEYPSWSAKHQFLFAPLFVDEIFG